MITLKRVSKRFGAIEALAPLDLSIPKGEWLGVFGRNGSGKTTLLRLLVGLTQPSSGELLIEEKRPGPDEWRRFRRKLGFMPERVALFDHLTGIATLRYFAELKGSDPAEIPPILERVGLTEAGGRKISGYSKGMRQRLNLAQALLGEPSVLVLDEPIEGLDAHGIRDFFAILASVASRTVVFSSHRLALIARHVDRVCVLSQGRVKALGSEDELYRKVDLPLQVVLRPGRDGDEALMGAIDRFEAASVVSRNGRIVVSVPQEEKMRFLAELRGLALPADIRFEEPSLEEALLETH